MTYLEKNGKGKKTEAQLERLEMIPMADGVWMPATMSAFGTSEELGFHRVNEDVPYIMVRIPEP